MLMHPPSLVRYLLSKTTQSNQKLTLSFQAFLVDNAELRVGKNNEEIRLLPNQMLEPHWHI
jgi:hypothetical protein